MTYPKKSAARRTAQRLLPLILAALMAAGCAGSIFQPGTSSSTGDRVTASEAASRQEHSEDKQVFAQNEAPEAEAPTPPAAPGTGGTVTTLDESDITPLQPVPIEGAENAAAEPAGEALEKEVDQEAAIQAEIDEALDYYEASQDFWQQGELDNALHALDQAYDRITSVDASDLAKFIQQKDDLRFMISKRVLEIYASRHTTAKGNHNAIPHEMNEHVEREVKFFTTGRGREFFIASYRRSGRYRPYILQELRKAGLPEDLSWIPLIESGFKTRALSRARALGLWQFISSTGYKFGLTRSQYIDERLDPFAATHAAIAYLKELHSIFGDWTTVMAGYNCGEYRVLRTIRTQNVNYLDNFWDLYRMLPRETARYVPKFMAALHIINNLEKYGMSGIEVDPPVQFETVTVEKQMYLKDVAKAMEIEKEVLTDLNPELRYKLTPDEAYELKVPPGNKARLLAKLEHIPEFTQAAPGIVYHRVRRGETLSTIASRYRTSVNQIALYNNLRSHHYIVAGKILKIPQSGAVAAASSSGKPITYTVRRGDSLWTLAKRYNTTTKKIQTANNLHSVNLYIGQKLKIPAAGHFSGSKVYRVRRGDSPYKIARRHGMSLGQFLQKNNLTRRSTIYPGQKVYVE
jgi:membrane-bound lytic murein transglycosylase D